MNQRKDWMRIKCEIKIRTKEENKKEKHSNAEVAIEKKSEFGSAEDIWWYVKSKDLDLSWKLYSNIFEVDSKDQTLILTLFQPDIKFKITSSEEEKLKKMKDILLHIKSFNIIHNKDLVYQIPVHKSPKSQEKENIPTKKKYNNKKNSVRMIEASKKRTLRDNDEIFSPRKTPEKKIRTYKEEKSITPLKLEPISTPHIPKKEEKSITYFSKTSNTESKTPAKKSVLAPSKPPPTNERFFLKNQEPKKQSLLKFEGYLYSCFLDLSLDSKILGIHVMLMQFFNV